jgi:hypothetical protein
VTGTPVSRTERIEEDRSVVGGEELVVWEGGLIVVCADEKGLEVVVWAGESRVEDVESTEGVVWVGESRVEDVESTEGVVWAGESRVEDVESIEGVTIADEMVLIVGAAVLAAAEELVIVEISSEVE